MIKSSSQAVSDVDVKVEITMPLSQWKALMVQTADPRPEEAFKLPLRDFRLAVSDAIRSLTGKVEQTYAGEAQ